MARPPRTQFQRHTSLPAMSTSTVDDLECVNAALGQLEMGQFRQASLLAEQMLRDDRIRGVMGTRIGALAAADLKFQASSDSAKAEKANDALRGYQTDDDQELLGDWAEMYPRAEVGQLLFWGHMVGVAVGQQIWSVNEEGRQVPHLQVWHPQFLRWDWTRRSYWLMTEDAGEIELPRLDENPKSDGEWIVWCPYGYYRGWMWSFVRWLATKYVMRGWDYRDWARYCEMHGQPKMVAYVPQSATKQQKDDYLDELASANGEMLIRIPIGDGGREKGWGVDMVEATARTWESFSTFKEALDTDIAIGILGQNQSTEIRGSSGSRASAQVHSEVKLERAQEDAAIADCLRRQGVIHWARLNFGDPRLAPVVTIDVEPPENQLEESQTILALGQGLTEIAAVSTRVDIDAILENFGLPMLSPEELAERRSTASGLTLTATEQGQIVTVNEARSAIGLGPWKDGDGDLPVSQFLDKHAPAVAAQIEGAQRGTVEAQDGLPTPGKKQPTGAQALSGVIVKRYVFQGMPVAVENAAGSRRVWADEHGGETGSTFMQHDYGFLEGVMGSDGEELDCYVGPDHNATDVHVVHQLRAPEFKVHDEDKTMLGFATPASAKRAYLMHRNDGEQAFGGMSSIPVDRFKAKLRRRTGTGKIRASAEAWQAARLACLAGMLELSEARPAQAPTVDVEVVQRSLSAQLRRGVAMQLAAKGRKGRGGRRARLYGDLVADRAIERAAKLMAPRLADVKDAIKAAGSLDKVKGEILRRYRTMDPAKLAALVRDARLMARLGGRAGALKQIR